MANIRGEFVVGISPSQFWGIFMVIAGVALFFALGYLEKRKKTKQSEEVVENVENIENVENVEKAEMIEETQKKENENEQ